MLQLPVVDGFVLTAYLIGTVLLGFWLGRGQQDAKSYLLGGRNAPWWAVLGSIVATETSTVTFLSVPGISFAVGGDLRFLQLTLGYIVGRTLIVVWLLPLYFRGELFSAYQLLQERFGRSTQRVASLIFLVTRNLGDGLRLYLTAVVLEKILAWPLSYCVITIGIVTIVFTVVGGMKSVIWNDCIQLFVYVLGGLIALVLIVGRLPDGFAGLWQFASETGRLELFDFRFGFTDPYTFWAGLIGGAFLTLGTHGTDQMMVQRALAARSQRDAGWALIASGFVVAVQFCLFLFVGIALAMFYSLHPQRESFASGDHVFAAYIVNELPMGIGLIGLLLAAVFSAAMSTLSSSLNSSATAVVNDWITTGSTQFSQPQIVWMSRLLTIVFGVLQIGIGIMAQDVTDAVIGSALAIAGFSAGLLLGLFALGGFLKRVEQTAALIGLVSGTVALLLVKFVLTRLEIIGIEGLTVAWPWFPVIGATVTFVSGWLAAELLTRNGDAAS